MWPCKSILLLLFLLFFRKPQQKLNQQFLSFFLWLIWANNGAHPLCSCPWVYISPWETVIITAEDGVGEERSHMSSRLPVKPIRRTLLMMMCIIIVLPRLNMSLIGPLFSWNTAWLASNISHWRQISCVLAFPAMTYRNLPHFSSREGKGVGPKNVSKTNRGLETK